jgi:F0F1-type ATP synthase assembly protein I
MKNESKSDYRDYAPYLNLGLQLALAVVIFFFIGSWIDQRYGTDPAGKIAGAVLGTIGGFIKFFKSVSKLVADEDRKSLKDKDEN